MMRWLLTGLLTVLALTDFNYDYANPGDAGNKKQGAAEQGGKGAKEAGGEKADFTRSAEELSKEFSTDRDAAEQKYQGKTIEVTGAVQMVVDSRQILLRGPKPNDEDYRVAVAVLIVDQDLYTANRLSAGQKVRVTGRYAKSLLGGAALVNCKLHELEPSKLVVATAESLAKEFATDATAAAKKYKATDIIVSGRVQESVQPKGGSAFIRLIRFATPGKTGVKIYMRADFEKGTAVEIRARFIGELTIEDNEVTLQQGFKVIEK